VKLSKFLSLLLLLEGRGPKRPGGLKDADVFENQCFGMPSDVPCCTGNTLNYSSCCTWDAVAQLGKALRYKPEGCGFDYFANFLT
jgi:hypothetical protein